MTEALPERARVVVVGGGVVGCSTAYHLVQAGWTDVLVLEQGHLSGGTTWHAAGLVGPLRATEGGTRLVQYSAELYDRLEAETGLATGYRNVGGVQHRGAAQVHQLVGHVRSPAGHVQRGQRGGAAEQGRAQAAVGLADVGHLPTRGHVPPPQDRATDPVRHQGDPCRPAHRGLAHLHRVEVEGGRAAEADEVALGGQREPEGVAAAVADVEEDVQEARGRPAVGRVAHLVHGVVAGHRVQQQVGDHVAPQPGGAPPRQPRGIGKARHGGRGYLRGSSAPWLG